MIRIQNSISWKTGLLSILLYITMVFNAAFAGKNDSVEECAAAGGILQGTPPKSFCFTKLKVPPNPFPDFDIAFSDGTSLFEDTAGAIALDELTGEAAVIADISFFGELVTFHDGIFFGAGIHAFDTLGGSTVNFEVGANQLAIGTHFDWTSFTDIFALTILNLGDPLTAIDSDFDGISGNKLFDSPFPTLNFSSSSTLSAVPIPAAVWLFGSALGLLGWMRRKTS